MDIEVNIGKIDRTDIYDKLNKLSDSYLTDISEANISLFANESKKMLDNVFDDFIAAQEQLYTGDSISAISDKKAKLQFTDVQDGYRRQMQNWVENHPIEVNKQTISIDDLPEDIPLLERESFKRSMSALGIGTVVVVGLRFLTGTKWIYLGELAVMALSRQQYQVGKEIDVNRQKQMQKDWFDAKKRGVINQIKQELDVWLDAAEEENNRVLKTFNL